MAELGALLWAPLNGRAQAATRSVSLPLLFRKLIHALIPAPLHFPPLSCSLLSVHLTPLCFFLSLFPPNPPLSHAPQHAPDNLFLPSDILKSLSSGQVFSFLSWNFSLPFSFPHLPLPLVFG